MLLYVALSISVLQFGQPKVHSSVVRAADCRSAGPWFKSGCALPVTRSLLGLRPKAVPKTSPSITHRGARTHDHEVKSLALYRLSYVGLLIKTDKQAQCTPVNCVHIMPVTLLYISHRGFDNETKTRAGKCIGLIICVNPIGKKNYKT